MSSGAKDTLDFIAPMRSTIARWSTLSFFRRRSATFLRHALRRFSSMALPDENMSDWPATAVDVKSRYV